MTRTPRTRKKIFKLNRGLVTYKSVLFKVANQQSMRASRYSHDHRKRRKGLFKRIWRARINAGARKIGMCYESYMREIRDRNILLNQKILAELAVFDIETFYKLVHPTL